MNNSIFARPATRHRIIGTLGAAALVLSAPLLLTSCAQSSEEDAAPQSSTAQTEPADQSAEPIALSNGWAKAAEGMSGIFGDLENNTDTDIVLVSAESPVAGMVELHETVTSGATTTMREIEGGFSIPAGESFELVPGGNHIMLMKMPEAIIAGEEVPVTLTFEDGSTVETVVLVKDYAGADENYEGETGHDAEEGHDAEAEHE